MKLLRWVLALLRRWLHDDDDLPPGERLERTAW